ncbi:MAG: hypothetical protein RSF40_04855 [Oscillospiraceae bacterium]
MEGEKITQVLSNETMNDHGYVVLSNGIDWKRYKGNNVLLLEHDWNSTPIGNVVNIHREGDDWIGELLFAPTAKGDECKMLYETGCYRAVSIGGYSQQVEQGGVTFATNFEVYEISLCALPSNPDAVSSYDGKKAMLPVEFKATKHAEMATLSADKNTEITNYLKTMDSKKPNLDTAEPANQEPQNVEPATDSATTDPEKLEGALKRAFLSIFGSKTQPLKEPEKLNTEVPIEPQKDPEQPISVEHESDPAAAAATEKSPEKLNVENTEPRIYKPQTTNTQIKMEAPKSVHQFLRTEEGKLKFSAMSRLGALTKEQLDSTEHRNELEFVREFVNLASSDKGFMNIMGNVTADINGERTSLSASLNKAKSILASGINSMNFVQTNPDLALVEWLTLFYRQLLPDDSWADRCSRVSGIGQAGVIWINSSIAPKIYFGKRAPLNLPGTTYDDTPIGIIENLFATGNIVWQQANTDLLAYDDVSTGTSETLRILISKIHNYYLQKIAEAASVKIPMSGASFASAGKFPINMAAAGNLKSLTPYDLTSLETAFINQNYVMETYAAEMVMDAIYQQQLKTDPILGSLLTKNAGTLRPNYGEYSGFQFRPRSITAAFDTSSSAVVDLEKYLDGKIANDGTVGAYVPPVPTATQYGLALGFIPSEVIIALGQTNVHMVSDPSNYGWRMSMDVRTGAGAARKGGLGIGIIRPTVG